MTQVIEGSASALEQLGKRIQQLEERVALLEGQAHGATGAATQSIGAPHPELPHPAAPWEALPAVFAPGGTFPVVGKAVLGMAGAFLLRAIAESGSVPTPPVLVIAIAYAVAWMVWAAKMHSSNRFASVTYAVTSGLILAPMLVECALRFRILQPWPASVVLVSFLLIALGLAWRRGLRFIPWVATGVSVSTVLVLMLATHALLPLITALLVLSLTLEAAALREDWRRMRVLPALAADLAVWLLIYIMTAPEGVPQGYPHISAAAIVALSLALLAISGASIGVNHFGLRRRISFFDIGQGTIAFLIAAWGSLSVGSRTAADGFGLLSLLMAAIFYWGALSRFTDAPYARNRRISATWAAALLVVGTTLLFSPGIRVAILCLAAIATAFVYTRTAKFTLGLHASLYLAVATAFSPLPGYATEAMAGTVPGAPHWSIWALVSCTGICYLVGSRGGTDHGKRRLLWVLPAALMEFAVAALLVAAAAAVTAHRLELTAPRLSMIRTIVICALAMVLGFLASRWKRAELGWLAYASVVGGSFKLLVEDLRLGNPATLVVSLLFYGLILILLPRLMRRTRTEP